MRWKHVHCVGVQRTAVWSDCVLSYQIVGTKIKFASKDATVQGHIPISAQYLSLAENSQFANILAVSNGHLDEWFWLKNTSC